MKTKTVVTWARLLALSAVIMALIGTSAFAAIGTSGPSPIAPAPVFQISTTKIILCQGMTNNVPITVRNLGSDYNERMNNVEVWLSGSGLTDMGPTEVVNVSNDTAVTVTVPLFVSLNTQTAIMAVSVPITYGYLSYYSDSEVRNLTFEVASCPSQLSMNVTPSLYVTGLVNNITFSFTNTGNTTLYDISASPGTTTKNGNQEVQFLGSFPIKIGALLPKNTVRFNQTVYENVSRTFTVNMTASFFNGSEPEQSYENFIMFSGGTIDMMPSSITVSPANVTAGSILSLSFVVTDTGTIGATGASATAIIPKGFRAYGTNSEYLGNIQTDTQTPVSLTLIANSSVKSGEYTVPVVITYQNNLMDYLNTTVDVPVTVIGGGGALASNSFYTAGAYAATRRRGGGAYIEIALAIAVVVLLVLLIRERRKSRHNKKG
jgi:hypothetical protein